MTPFEIAYHAYSALMLLAILWLPVAYSSKRKFRTTMIAEVVINALSFVFMVISVGLAPNAITPFIITWSSLEAVIIMEIVACGREVNKVRVSEVK